MPWFYAYPEGACRLCRHPAVARDGYCEAHWAEKVLEQDGEVASLLPGNECRQPEGQA